MVNNLIAFYAAFLFTGFFGGSIPTVMAYLGDLYVDRVERSKRIGALGGVALSAMGLAGIIGKFVYEGTGRLYNGSLVAVGASAAALVGCAPAGETMGRDAQPLTVRVVYATWRILLSFARCHFLVPEPAKDWRAELRKPAPKMPPTPWRARSTLYGIFVAMFVDTMGWQGLQVVPAPMRSRAPSRTLQPSSRVAHRGCRWHGTLSSARATIPRAWRCSPTSPRTSSSPSYSGNTETNGPNIKMNSCDPTRHVRANPSDAPQDPDRDGRRQALRARRRVYAGQHLRRHGAVSDDRRGGTCVAMCT